MLINTTNLISISEANQNFSRVARLVDENGAAVILKNNSPRYIIFEYSKFEDEKIAENEDVQTVGNRIISRNIKAFKELSK